MLVKIYKSFLLVFIVIPVSIFTFYYAINTKKKIRPNDEYIGG